MHQLHPYCALTVYNKPMNLPLLYIYINQQQGHVIYETITQVCHNFFSFSISLICAALPAAAAAKIC